MYYLMHLICLCKFHAICIRHETPVPLYVCKCVCLKLSGNRIQNPPLHWTRSSSSSITFHPHSLSPKFTAECYPSTPSHCSIWSFSERFSCQNSLCPQTTWPAHRDLDFIIIRVIYGCLNNKSFSVYRHRLSKIRLLRLCRFQNLFFCNLWIYLDSC